MAAEGWAESTSSATIDSPTSRRERKKIFRKFMTSSFLRGEGARVLLALGGVAPQRPIDDGGEVDADIVVIGIGIVPNVELAADCGLEVGDGIVVDEHCQTSDPRIYAIGDCTWHPNRILGTDLRLWDALMPHLPALIALSAASPVAEERHGWFKSYRVALRAHGCNLPNLITLSRLLMTAVFVVAASLGGAAGNGLALVMFILAATSDWLDGYLARRLQLQGDMAAYSRVIAEAHRHNVLHRDLKPENVLIPRDGRLRVVDFGLAKTIVRDGEPAPLPLPEGASHGADPALEDEPTLDEAWAPPPRLPGPGAPAPGWCAARCRWR